MTSTAELSGGVGSRGRSMLARYRKSLWPVDSLSRGFWIFFAAAFCFDFGFGLYFFLFNLFLANLHFNERVLGFVTGALTLGNVAGTIPISLLAKRLGLQKLILFCFIASPLISVLRTLILWMPAQIGLAFFTGVALSAWPVCFSPAVARLTTENNRVSAFSVIFATGIGTGTLAGLVGGYVPGLLKFADGSTHLVSGMRLTLAGACVVAMFGIWPMLKLKLMLGPTERSDRSRSRIFHPYLFRFLPAFALWSIVTGSFVPFAPVFLQQQLKMPLKHIGLVFSGSQLTQFVAALLAPLLYRRFGTIAGIMCAQIATGAAVFALGRSQNVSNAVACYLGYSGVLFMSGPGFYSMLMSKLPDDERSTASAVQNIASALCQAGAVGITGSLLVRYGYPTVLSINAIAAIAAALLLFVLLGWKSSIRT